MHNLDSGTISEESSLLSFPAVTIRNSIERPEALDTGSIILTGFDEQVVLDSVHLAMQEPTALKKHNIPADYQVSNTSWRVLKLIVGTCKISNVWSGIQKY